MLHFFITCHSQKRFAMAASSYFLSAYCPICVVAAIPARRSLQRTMQTRVNEMLIIMNIDTAAQATLQPVPCIRANIFFSFGMTR